MIMTDQLLKQGLHTWPKPVKLFLVGFLFLLTSGVTIGVFFLFTTTSFTAGGTVEHYNGSSVSADDPLAIQEKYPKPLSEILLTTHNHFIGFSFIFFILGGLFYFNSTINGRLKNFLLVEPFVSTWLTFISIWGLRYINSNIVYVTIIAALLTYASFYLLVFILLYELCLKKD